MYEEKSLHLFLHYRILISFQNLRNNIFLENTSVPI